MSEETGERKKESEKEEEGDARISCCRKSFKTDGGGENRGILEVVKTGRGKKKRKMDRDEDEQAVEGREVKDD